MYIYTAVAANVNDSIHGHIPTTMPSVHTTVVYKFTFLLTAPDVMITLHTCNRQHRQKLPVVLSSFNKSTIT